MLNTLYIVMIKAELVLIRFNVTVSGGSFRRTETAFTISLEPHGRRLAQWQAAAVTGIIMHRTHSK